MPAEEVIKKPEEIVCALVITGTLKIHKVIRKYNSRNIISNLSIYLTKASRPLSSSIDDPAICDYIDVEVDNNTCVLVVVNGFMEAVSMFKVAFDSYLVFKDFFLFDLLSFHFVCRTDLRKGLLKDFCRT